MRLACLFCSLLVLVGISVAQQPDSNFAVGPQYLVTGSPEFARPIQTPSMSLDAPLPPIPALPEIGPPVNDQPYTVVAPELQNQPYLFGIYYGYPQLQMIELVGTEAPRELPESLVETGVTRMTTAQSLRDWGYDVPVGEDAIYWKTHKPRTPRVYTNADVARLGSK